MVCTSPHFGQATLTGSGSFPVTVSATTDTWTPHLQRQLDTIVDIRHSISLDASVQYQTDLSSCPVATHPTCPGSKGMNVDERLYLNLYPPVCSPSRSRTRG